MGHPRGHKARIFSKPLSGWNAFFSGGSDVQERRLSRICCVRVRSAAQNESVGRPVQNVLGFLKIIKIRLVQSLISSRTHSKMRRYALRGDEPENAYKNIQ